MQRSLSLQSHLPKIKKLVGSPVEELSHLEKWGLFLFFADDESKRGYIDRIVSSEGGIMNARTALNAVSQDDINWALQGKDGLQHRSLQCQGRRSAKRTRNGP